MTKLITNLFNRLIYNHISLAAFFFLADLGLLPLFGLLEGTSLGAGTSSSRQLSLKLIRVESGILSLRISLSLSIAWMAC